MVLLCIDSGNTIIDDEFIGCLLLLLFMYDAPKVLCGKTNNTTVVLIDSNSCCCNNHYYNIDHNLAQAEDVDWSMQRILLTLNQKPLIENSIKNQYKLGVLDSNSEECASSTGGLGNRCAKPARAKQPKKLGSM